MANIEAIIGRGDHSGSESVALMEQFKKLTARVCELEARGAVVAKKPPTCFQFFCISTGLGSGQFGSRLIAVYLILQWMFFSCAIILYNRYILHDLDFPYPLSIVLMHMTFVTICCHAWKRAGWVVVPSISWSDVLWKFVPVAIFFGGSLAFANAAYLYISVAFIQMMKASTPVFVLLASFAFRLEKPTWSIAGWITIIFTGVTIASFAQVDVVVMGVVVQVIALVCESVRLALINKVLVSKGLKLVPVAFLYYMAPLCALVLLVPWCVIEAPHIFADSAAPIRNVGAIVLLTNASIAFLLNLATMALIKHTSALTLNVSGVFKDLILILWSVFVNGAVVTLTQYVGYSIAVFGVVGYSEYKRRLGVKPKPVLKEKDVEVTESAPERIERTERTSTESTELTPTDNALAAVVEEAEQAVSKVTAQTVLKASLALSDGGDLTAEQPAAEGSKSKRKAGGKYTSFGDDRDDV